MSRIPQSFIEDLLNRIDIVDIIDARISLRKTGNNYSARCPFHNEKTPSFTVSPAKQFYYCFGCSAHGNAIGFLMQYEHLEFMDAVEALASKAGLEIPREPANNASQETSQQDLYNILSQAARYYQVQLKQSPQAIEYLKSRGVSGEIAKQFGIGYAPEGWDHLKRLLATTNKVQEQLIQAGMLITKSDSCYDRFRARIMFPIRDLRGRVIAFGGRTLGPELPKYLNSPETPIFHKGHELYGLYEARRANQKLERVIIVEGYMDVIALAQHGISYAVATLGTATSSKHIHRLERYTTEIVFCFDGDAAGQQAAWRALETVLTMVRDGCQFRFMFLPNGEDPDSLIRKEGAALFTVRITDAISLSDFFFTQLQQQIDLTTADGKARFAKQAMLRLQKMPHSIFQELMYEKLSVMIGIDVAKLEEFIQTPLATPSPAAPQLGKAKQTQSPIALAITLLLQYPSLAPNALDLQELGNKTTLPGLPILVKLLEILQRHPHSTTGMLLEHWRGQKPEVQLAQLAAQELMLPMTALTAEFQGAIARIREAAREQMLQDILTKAKKDGLSEKDRLELQQLLNL